MIARYGGEEFCAFIRNYNKGNEALFLFADNIRKNIEHMMIGSLSGTKFDDDGYKHRTITVAAGIRKKGEPIDLFMHDVDSFLTKKDKGGRNKVYLRT